jgi:hypothetical protein
MFDYPAIYKEADNISNKTQKNYLWILKAFLFLLILSSILFTYFDNIFILKLLNTIVSLIIVVLSFVFQFRNFQGTWYNARAVAESIKTISWRYSVKAEPYDISDIEAKSLFMETVKHIIDMNHDFQQYIEAEYGSHQAISDSMTATRQLSLQERFTIYHENRVREQKNWYKQKSLFNKRQSSIFFWILIIISLALFVLLVLNMKEINSSLFPIGTLLSVISVLFTWVQTKKYKELEKSYALATHEIGFIETHDNDTNEKLFSDYVINAENAFSREHTQWIARKDTSKTFF